MDSVQSPLFPCNNDRIGHMTAFRSPSKDGRVGTMYAGAAAPALVSAPPRPTHLNEEQAEAALDAIQREAVQSENTMCAAHSGLDADRVARLLGLLQ